MPQGYASATIQPNAPVIRTAVTQTLDHSAQNLF
jgi:hypothetical protein